nr:uncharacterized protein LOC107449487 [Parasteatoda tepidariorum]
MTYFVGLLLMTFFIGIDSSEVINDIPPIVEAVVGGKALIPCNVSSPLEDDEATLVLWYRVDMPNPIYTLDVRNAGIRSAKHFPSTEIKDRAKFDVSVHPPVLILTDVTLKDQADYRCRIDLRKSRTLIIHSRLRIIVMPLESKILGSRIILMAGEEHEFVCETRGSRQKALTSWWLESHKIGIGTSEVTRENGNVTLSTLIFTPSPTDNGKRLICKSANPSLPKATIEDEKILRVQFAPLVNLTYGSNINKGGIKEGARLSMECSIWANPWIFEVAWQFEDKSLVPNKTNGIVITNQTLELQNVKREHRGKYRCFASNTIGQGSSNYLHLKVQCKFVLDINPAFIVYPLYSCWSIIPRRIIIIIRFTPVCNHRSAKIYGITPLETANVTCDIDASPREVSYKWSFNSSGEIKILQNWTMNASKKHFIFSHQRMSGYVTPVCNHRSAKIYGITPLETANVTCDIDASPREVSYKWSFNSSGEIKILQNWTMNASKKHFIFSHQRMSGYGTLLCWTKNSIGHQKEPCTIKIVPAGEPEPPHDCTIINQTSSSLTIDCEAGYNGSLQQSFHLEAYDSIAEHITANLTKLEKPSFHVDGLIPGTSYVLVIYSSNIKGKSNSVALVASTALPAEKRTAKDDNASLSSFIWILIGVLTIVIVSVLVAIILIRIHVQKGVSNKEPVIAESTSDCEITKKELEDSQESNSEKGPDIIPLSIETDVFYTSRISEESIYHKKDSPSPKYIREKYTDTVL